MDTVKQRTRRRRKLSSQPPRPYRYFVSYFHRRYPAEYGFGSTSLNCSDQITDMRAVKPLTDYISKTQKYDDVVILNLFPLSANLYAKWIPVNDSLPLPYDGQRVLVFRQAKKTQLDEELIAIATFEENQFSVPVQRNITVSHWKPLYGPPEEEHSSTWSSKGAIAIHKARSPRRRGRRQVK